MPSIIKVQGLGKQYRIGTDRSAYSTLRDALASTLRSSLRRGRRNNGQEQKIWALRDVNFEVNAGEVVGIIGRNGAGKSTLLKILSRVTEPTAGRVELHGRVGSLLEVGTGFHPELSGRENIYLNGAILGMRRAEIARNFDDIVAFAEVEKFLDTPVKRYSSGMYVRLAFAVAAHLEPEILIVDEVLAVGDAHFQRKCMNKMQDVSQRGRTVLFVSHNMAAISRLCARTIMLDEGHISQDGPSHKTVGLYLGLGPKMIGWRKWPDISKAPGDDTVRMRAVRVRQGDDPLIDFVDVRRPVLIDIEYDVLKPGRRLSAGIICNNKEGICVFSSADLSPDSIYGQDVSMTGRRISTCTIPGNLLAEGTFTISASIYAILDGVTHANESDAVGFMVADSSEGDTARGVYTGPVIGVVRPMLQWDTEFLDT